jgi:hypothetical protein
MLKQVQHDNHGWFWTFSTACLYLLSFYNVDLVMENLRLRIMGEKPVQEVFSNR